MSAALRSVAFAVPCVLAVVVLLWPSAPSEPAPGQAAGTPNASRTDPANVADTGRPVRDPVAPVHAAPVAAGWTVRGRCLADEDAAPLRALVQVAADDDSERASAAPAQPLVSVVAGDDGRFVAVVPLAATGDLRLFVQSPDRAAVGGRRRDAGPGGEWDVGDLHLVRTARVRGEVLDTGGAMVAGAEVMLVKIGQDAPEVTFRDSHVAISDARGAFVFADAVAAGEWYVRVDRTGGLRTPRKTQVPAGGEHVVPIEVERPDPALAIRGTVVDRLGAPLAGIRLSAYGEGARGSAVSEADGSFVLPKGPPHFDRGQAGVEVQARGDGLEQSSPTPEQRTAWGQHDVRVVMRPLTELVLRAVDARGQAVWPFTVLAGRLTANGEAWVPTSGARLRAAGDHLVLPGLESGAHSLLLPADDLASARTGPVHFVIGETSPRELVVHVPDPVAVRLELVDVAGAPVPRCTAQLVASLHQGAADAAAPAVELAALRRGTGRPVRQFVLATAISDADGLAVLLAPPGDWLLRTSATTHLPLVRTVAIRAASPPQRLVLEAAAVVHGRLVPVEVLPALGLHETKPERRLAVVARVGKNDVARAEVAADGTFELGPLPAGFASLRLASWLTANDVHGGLVTHALGDLDGAGAAVVQREYDVRAFAPATVTGQLVFDGMPVRNGQFFFRRVQPEPVMAVRVATDGDGAFRSLVPPGEFGVQLAIPSDPGPGHVILLRPERWSLTAGQSLSLRLEATPRRLRLRLLLAGGAPLANTRAMLQADGYERPGSLQTDAQGRLEVALAPYGAFRVQAKDGRGVDLVSAPCTFEPAAEVGVVDVLLTPR